MSIDELIEQGGARADSTPAFVYELLRSLEERIVKLEGPKEPEKSAQTTEQPPAV